ncbi:tachystatin-A2 [Tachypleus tridentatus]|uniref:tachystatin-A2 n=1 Tax=Tachypleus tridentatus TaxID=6853 RepID=UPI003FCEEF90
MKLQNTLILIGCLFLMGAMIGDAYSRCQLQGFNCVVRSYGLPTIPCCRGLTCRSYFPGSTYGRCQRF